MCQATWQWRAHSPGLSTRNRITTWLIAGTVTVSRRIGFDKDPIKYAGSTFYLGLDDGKPTPPGAQARMRTGAGRGEGRGVPGGVAYK